MTIYVKCNKCGKMEEAKMDGWRFGFPDGWQQFSFDVIAERKTLLYHYCPECFKVVNENDTRTR